MDPKKWHTVDFKGLCHELTQANIEHKLLDLYVSSYEQGMQNRMKKDYHYSGEFLDLYKEKFENSTIPSPTRGNSELAFIYIRPPQHPSSDLTTFFDWFSTAHNNGQDFSSPARFLWSGDPNVSWEAAEFLSRVPMGHLGWKEKNQVETAFKRFYKNAFREKGGHWGDLVLFSEYLLGYFNTFGGTIGELLQSQEAKENHNFNAALHSMIPNGHKHLDKLALFCNSYGNVSIKSKARERELLFSQPRAVVEKLFEMDQDSKVNSGFENYASGVRTARQALGLDSGGEEILTAEEITLGFSQIIFGGAMKEVDNGTHVNLLVLHSLSSIPSGPALQSKAEIYTKILKLIEHKMDGFSLQQRAKFVAALFTPRVWISGTRGINAFPEIIEARELAEIVTYVNAIFYGKGIAVPTDEEWLNPANDLSLPPTVGVPLMVRGRRVAKTASRPKSMESIREISQAMQKASSRARAGLS